MAEDITYPEPTDKIHPLETSTWIKTSVVGNGASGEENKYDGGLRKRERKWRTIKIYRDLKRLRTISATRCPFLYSVSMFHTLIAEYVFSSEKKKEKKRREEEEAFSRRLS